MSCFSSITSLFKAAIIFSTALLTFAPASAKTQGKAAQVKAETERIKKENENSKIKLNEKEKKIKSNLARLNEIENKIELQVTAIAELNDSVLRITDRCSALRDSIVHLQYEDSILCVKVAENLRRRHVQSERILALAFIASAKSLSDAQLRLNHLNVTQRALNKHVTQLRQRRSQLENSRKELEKLQESLASAIKQLDDDRIILDNRYQEVENIVKNLQSESFALKKSINDNNCQIEQLNKQLRQTNSDPPRRPTSSGTAQADRKLKGSFQANKGNLLFPVAGKYSVTGHFGQSRHRTLRYVTVYNPGIDISVARGTKARAVFEGTVAEVAANSLNQNVVLIRHGNYITLYAGLKSLKVRKGDRIKTGQEIGEIISSKNGTVLHFELHNEKTPLDPLQWIK